MRESKTSITREVQENIEYPASHIEFIIDYFMTTLIGHLKAGDDIEIRGLGTFIIKETKERIRINPKTKERLIQPPQKTVAFKLSHKLKEDINDKEQTTHTS